MTTMITRDAALKALRAPIEVRSEIAPVSRDTIGVRLGLLRLQRAPKAPLGVEETLSTGCEVVLSSVCWSAGTPVPMSALVNATVVIGEMIDGDRLSFELAGKRVPGEHTLSTSLTALFPVPEFRGQRVRQQVWLKSASRLELAAQLDPADANASLVAALEQERERAVEARASETVVAELGARLGLGVTAEQVRAHALTMWHAIDQPRLIALGLGDAICRRAQAVWCSTPGILDWASRQLVASSVLSALFEARVLDAPLAARDAEAALKAVGVGAAQLAKAEPAQAERLYSSAVINAARRQLVRLPCVEITSA